MANTYTSTNVENGLTFDELLGRLLAFKPNQWGSTEQDYNEIITDFGVSSNDLWYLPTGNYKVTNLPNSPFNSSFVNISVFEISANKKIYICDIGGIEKYSTELTAAGATVNWVDITNIQRDKLGAVIFYTGENAPTDTTMMWIDTSKLSTNDAIYLRYHNGTNWVSYSYNNIMLQDIYDKNKVNKDPYEAIDSAISEFIGNYPEFTKHTKNELALIHISTEDRTYYNSYLLTSTQLTQYFAEGGDLYNELIEYINSKTADVIDIDLAQSEAIFNELNQQVPQHISGTTALPHISEADVNKWNKKSDKDHTHQLDDKVTISSSNIQPSKSSSVFTLDQISSAAQERAYPISNITILASKPSASELENKYHNGNTLYVDNSDGTSTWWKIIDNTKFGTADYMLGLREFSSRLAPIPFSQIENRPTTFAGYGITDGVTKSFVEDANGALYGEIMYSAYSKTNLGTKSLYLGIQKSTDPNGGSLYEEMYPMSTNYSDLDIIVAIDNDNRDDFTGVVSKFSCLADPVFRIKETTISFTDKNWNKVCYGNGMFVAVGAAKYFIYSLDGITWNQCNPNATSRIWRSVCYGNGKFVAVSGDGYVAYSTDGITWQMKSISTNSNLTSVCYGNGKFVATEATKFHYSSNGIDWAQCTGITTAANWISVCYGKDKFVAVITSSSNTYAYSTDGITWTEGTISNNTPRIWSSICYGNDKFVIVANNSNYCAYSSDGITWTERVMSNTIRNWSSVCYGKDKFVAVSSQSITYAYSSDGITWIEDNIGDSNKNWYSVCYGNDKYVAISYNSTFAYISEYYLLPGMSFHKTDIPSYEYFNYLVDDDEMNAEWEEFGLGRMLKVDTSAENTIIDDVFEINGSTYDIWILWHPIKGLVFRHRIDKFIKNANTVLNNLNKSKGGLSSFINTITANIEATV